MKTTMPLWIGLMMLMFLLVLGASFPFLYMELNEERNALVVIEGTVTAQSEGAALVEGTIVALGDQLTQQAVPLADYAATSTAATLFVNEVSEPTISETVEVSATAVVSDVVSEPTPTLNPSNPSNPINSSNGISSSISPIGTPTLISETVVPEASSFEIPAGVTPTASPELPVADVNSSSITIIFPKEGDALIAGEGLFLDTVILDEAGVSQAWLAVDGIEVNRFSINDFPEFNYTPRWIPEDVGERELTVGAVNREGFAIRPQTVIVTVGNSATDDG